jgi:parallel beta-helix repeat protein
VSPAFRRLSLLALLALLAAFAPLARPALANSYTVTSFADSGPGTLRQAILDANASAGADTITFSGPGTIDLAEPLPALTGGSIRIDGTFPANGTAPKVEIRGGGAIQGAGILIHSSNNTIRGLILNGFVREPLGTSPDWGGAGVTISGSASGGVASGNVVEYNYIGTNAAGNAIGAPQGSNNFTAGVLIIVGASGNTVRSNVISGNQGPGIYLTRDRDLVSTAIQNANVIRDNIVGLTADGTAALPNITNGIQVGSNSQNTVIGPGNVISGNGKGAQSPASPIYGVKIVSDAPIDPPPGVFRPRGTVVKGNKIGTNPAGTVAIPNRDGGVLVGPSTNTTIGGATVSDPNERNLISGNNAFGIALEDYFLDNTQRTIGAVVQNNWIGLDAAGTAPLPNNAVGVLLRTNVGGARVGPGNVISGNGNPSSQAGGIGVQVLVTSSDVSAARQADTNEISDNLIGTAPGGSAVVANQDYGVQLVGDTFANTIKNNRIAGNQQAGVETRPNTSTPAPHGNTVRDNQVGVLANNALAGNGGVGVLLSAGSSQNTIGPGNQIAGHTSTGADGLRISGAGTNNNIVTGNNVVSNATGIHVTNGAVGNEITQTTTSNNAGKGILLDQGGNAEVDPSRLTVNVPAQGLTLTGTAAGCTAAPSCKIEVFDSDSQLDNEGPRYLTSATTTANGSFSVDITGCKHYLIFTLTDQSGNTSEFIKPTGNIAQCVPVAPIVVLSDPTPASPQGALPGTTRTFRHTVSNTGTGPGALTISSSSSNAWPTALDTTACPNTLAAGASCVITLTVTVPPSAQAGEFNDTTITAALAGATATAKKTDRTIVLSQPALEFLPASQTQSAGPGQPVSFQHTLTNKGNGPDTFAITVTAPLGWNYTVAPAGPIALAKGAAISVTITLTPPAGIDPGSYPTIVRAKSTSDPNVFKDATDTTTIAGAAVPQIASTLAPANINPGGTATITYTVTNAGNQAGTFNLAFTPPAGWSVTQGAPASVTLAKGASQAFAVEVQAPNGAIAGAYTARLAATATDANGATATKADTIMVNQVASVSLTPESQTTAGRGPGAVYTDTVTLTNGGNFTDTIALAASSSQGWTVRPVPESVTLDPGASQPIQVVLTIPPGVPASTPNTTTITATSSLAGQPQGSDTATIVTSIISAPGGTFTPPLLAQSVEAGKPVTYTFSLQNTGNITQSFEITATGVPAGWFSSVTPPSAGPLAPLETASVQLVLRAPAGTPTGTTADVKLTATSDQAPNPVAEATARVRIGAAIDVELGGACNNVALPGAIVACAHTITNTGLTDNTFTIVAVSPLGWETPTVPSGLFVPAGQSATFTVTLQVPTSANAGLVHKLTIMARSKPNGAADSQVEDTTTVQRVAGVSFSPGQARPTAPGKQIKFQHVLINTGNAPDSFAITATQELSWTITIVPTQTVSLPHGVNYPVEVYVQIPEGAPLTASNRIIVRATSKFDPNIYDELLDVVSPLAAAPRQLVFVPLISQP